MATIKSYSDLEQSKKLADILPTESADMRYAPFGDTHPWFWDGHLLEKGAIPYPTKKLWAADFPVGLEEELPADTKEYT